MAQTRTITGFHIDKDRRENAYDFVMASKRRTFVIKQGHHYPKQKLCTIINPFYFHKAQSIKGYFSIEPNEFGTYRNDDDLSDWNKLVGLGFGFNHHKNSIRIAWKKKWNERGFEIAAYYYDGNSKEHKSFKLCEVPPFQEIYYSISRIDNRYLVKVDNVLVHIKNEYPDPVWGRILTPYYGGDNTAPVTVKINLVIEKKNYNE